MHEAASEQKKQVQVTKRIIAKLTLLKGILAAVKA
tara:strand:- start:383 stop:487 length:105 start_codon:yes stop_codon:yes gene_type:complete